MDLSLSGEDVAFRKQVRGFLDRALPPDLREKVEAGEEITKDDHTRWWSIIHGRGWIAPSWPVEEGGPGWTLTQQYIFDQELARTSAPILMPFNIRMIGPVLRAFGTEAQKSRFLPGTLDGGIFWCQGFSEPGAGSDLASLNTRARREGDDYLVTGQKIWTSYAHWADWMFCLVRTRESAKPQQGISVLLIDMKSPGVEVRPIVTIDEHHHLNEVFFDNVRVPAENLIGVEHDGWTCAKYLLGHERTGLTGVAETQFALQKLRSFLSSSEEVAQRLAHDRHFQRRLTVLEARLKALEVTELRTLAKAQARGAPGPEVSILKLIGAQLQQQASELALEAMGIYANAFAPKSQTIGTNEEAIGPDFVTPNIATFLFKRAATIYGGSDEVQRNVISKAVLGL